MYRTKVFYPIVDRMVEELQRRFSSENETVYNGINALCSKSDTFFDQTALQKFALYYKEVVFESNDNDSNLLQLKNEIVAAKFLLDDKLRKMQTQDKNASLSAFDIYTELKGFESFKTQKLLLQISMMLSVTTAS